MNDRDLPPEPWDRGTDCDGDVLAARNLPPAAARPPGATPPRRFEPPTSALGPLFRYRLEQIHVCRVSLTVDVNTRPTRRVLGGYYKSRRLVRVYSHDRVEGPRPLERALRNVSARGRPSSRVHRASKLRLARMPPEVRADAQPALLADSRRAQVALGQSRQRAGRLASRQGRALSPSPPRRSPAFSTLISLSIDLITPSLSI